MTALKPWQVWLMKMDPQVGNEQAGTRPVIVIGSQVMLNAAPGLILVAPCTTRHRNAPFQPPIQLQELSFVMVEQVRSLSRLRLVKRLPHKVPHNTRQEIRWALTQLIG